jgi:hypothetical protein
MCAYINPKEMEKEEWLIRNGRRVHTAEEAWAGSGPGYMPVVLLDNGYFTAAGIAYSRSEFEYFANPDDARPKYWFIVDVEKLHKVSPELKRYMCINKY